ncbi:PEP-CTERM sorting domain-containing protein [Coleofasciculus sp. G1-WW12-02]
MAIEVETQTVPEPFTIVGQGVALGLGLIYTRRKQKTNV